MLCCGGVLWEFPKAALLLSALILWDNGARFESVSEDSNSGKHNFWNTFWCSPSIRAFATCMSLWLPWVNFSCLDNSFSWELFHHVHLLRFIRMRSFIIVISQHRSFWYKQSSSDQSPECLYVNSGKVMLIPEKFLILQRSSEKKVFFFCLFVF